MTDVTEADPHGRVSVMATLLDAILPPRCVLCERDIASTSALRTPGLCGRCLCALPWWRIVDGCPRCGTRPPTDGANGAACAECLSRQSSLHTCHALLRYEGPARRWIPATKRTPRGLGPPGPVVRVLDELALIFADRLAATLQDRLDVIVGIPLHRRRLRARGANHVDPIARRLARRLGLPFAPRLLSRVRHALPQASLRGEARRVNLRGAFRVTDRLDPALRVGLVDDVLTTGSTLESAADALLEAGALEVRAFALAATLPEQAQRRSPGSEHGLPLL